MYDSDRQNAALVARYDWSKGVLFTRGTPADVLVRHHMLADRAAAAGIKAIRSAAPHLLKIIGDPRTLRLAWVHSAATGGHAPGPNGHRYANYSSAEVWERCRRLATAIRSGAYRPGGERVVEFPKASGHGVRRIVLLDIEDRVVQRAAVLVLQPLLDPLFDDRAFGFRPGRDYRHALVTAEWVAEREARWVWVCDDLKDAFLNVRVSRLLQVVHNLLPADDLIAFLGRVLPARRLPGLRQGGALSPLMLMTYLNHFLDRPWRKAYPDRPLVRVADDIVVLCKTRTEARAAHTALATLLRPTGLTLKFGLADGVRDLRSGSADWLGLAVSKAADGLALRLTSQAWARLDRRLALAHLKPLPTVWARLSIEAWLRARACCAPWTDSAALTSRVAAAATGAGFDEIPGRRALAGVLAEGHRRWAEFRNALREQLAAAAP